MTKIRVLVVDDAVVVRRLVADALSAVPDLEIAGVAANGSIALQKIPQCSPDVVTLDIEMPVLDGLETLKRIRELYPDLPVIMFSTLTERGAAATFDALALGASDYVTKPANVGRVGLALERVRDELAPKIRALCRPQPPAPAPPSTSTRPATPVTAALTPPRPRTSPGDVEVVAVGVSTGGPNALATITGMLPGTFSVPIVIVQHMPPMFTRLLAERLDARSELRVVEATPQMVLEPGVAYVAPGDYHLTLRRVGHRVLTDLNQAPPENSCRPAVNVLFRSVAAVYGKHALALILTGMGSDGLLGCERIREVGGTVLAQDETSSVIWGMPGYVVEGGLAERVLPLATIGPELSRRVAGNTAGRPVAVGTAR